MAGFRRGTDRLIERATHRLNRGAVGGQIECAAQERTFPESRLEALNLHHANRDTLNRFAIH